jgi:2-desacetyl-2-hydroxyethyl bacteriochlorophyllide A dehydrogenase
MKTIVLTEPGRFHLAETPEPPAPGPGEARVRVHRVGICGTDLHAYRGRQPFFTYPRILGHELGVEVVEVGDSEGRAPGAAGIRAGDHCAVEPYLNCGSCIACRRGKTNCCVELKVLGVHTDGGMREFITVPTSKLHHSETLSWEQLALVETLGIGAHAVGRAGLEAGEFVLVVGAGPIGLSVVQFAQLMEARVIVLDVNEGRLEFCRRQLGVKHALLAGTKVVEELQSLTGGDLPTAVFDATGSPESMARSFQYVAHGGRLVLVGLCQADIAFSDPEFHRRELTLLATRNSTRTEFERILRLLEEDRIDTTPWITHRAVCDSVPGIFSGWLDPTSGVVKAMVEF